MRLEPAAVSGIHEDLAMIELSLRRTAFQDDQLIRLITQPVTHSPNEIMPATQSDLTSDIKEGCGRDGWQIFDADQVAVCIMAGRSDHLLEPLHGIGISTLAMKLMQTMLSAWGKSFRPPVWIVVSSEERDEVEYHLVGLTTLNSSKVHLVEQRESYVFTPMGRIAFEDEGVPSVGPLGTGEVPRALLDDGCLQEFIERGGKYVVMLNANNLLATPDIAMVGQHARRGVDITCEVVRRKPNVSGGFIAWAENRLVVLEDRECAFASSVDVSHMGTYLNTNTFVVNVEALVDSVHVPWRYHRVRRVVDDKVFDGFEAAIGQMTEQFETDYIEVPADLRHMPIRSHLDVLEAQDVFKRLSLGTMER